MSTPKKYTDELAEQPRTIERVTCPYCHNDHVEVIRIAGARMLQYHHDERKGFFEWCKPGIDLNLDEYEATHERL